MSWNILFTLLESRFIFYTMAWDQPLYAQRFEQALSTKGWTQKILAEKLTRAPATVSAWKERADAKPGLNEIMAVAEALEVTPCWLAFGGEGTARDAEELAALRLMRDLPAEQRAGCLEALRAMARLAPDQELLALGEKARARQEAKTAALAKASGATFQTSGAGGAPTPGAPSGGPGGERPQSEPLRLPPDELEAFLGWILGQVELMPAERPLTKACRAIATRLARDNAPAASAGSSAGSGATTDAAGKDAPSAAVPSLPPSRRKVRRLD